jgi:hypothetical protein
MPRPFYDYFEEWPIGASGGTRRRNVRCRVATRISEDYSLVACTHFGKLANSNVVYTSATRKEHGKSIVSV